MAQIIHLATGRPGADLICLSAKPISEQKAVLMYGIINIY